AQIIDSIFFQGLEEKLPRGESVVLPLKYGFYNCFGWNEPDPNEIIINTLLVYLRNHDDVRIRLSHHTDCRGDDTYNQLLSEKISQNFKVWFLRQGISTFRIEAKGMGESSPIVPCSKCDCNEEIHNQNKRTEIIKIN
ncbi:MAG: OmpA family protein, partial [Lewinella sp.]|nr:OmpA family protein [Lewinella sp.]